MLRPFTEDEADTAYAIQRLLTDEGPLIPLGPVSRRRKAGRLTRFDAIAYCTGFRPNNAA
jgi:hypothetical protein